jgi:hypothetical protein
MALSKSEVRRPALPKRAVAVPELGGEVVVRGLLLKDRLALFRDGSETRDYEFVANVLAVTVLDNEGEPLFTSDEWNEFGAVHIKAAMDLFGVASELSGLRATVEGDPEKNP